MNCKEFQDQMVNLFDKECSPDVKARLITHMDECASCRAEYESMLKYVDMLQPKHSPVWESMSPKHSTNGLGHRLLRVAASVAIFLLGVGVGISNFFSQNARATDHAAFTLSQAIDNVRNVGSIHYVLKARMKPNDNFADFYPELNFINIDIKKVSLDGDALWRIEKDGGRTVVCDGQHQYLFGDGITPLVGSVNAGFLDQFALLLLMPHEHIYYLQKKHFINDKRTVLTQTETENIITINKAENQYGLEMVFSKNDGLLRSIKVWHEEDGQKTTVLESVIMDYNVSIDKAQLLALPFPSDDSRWNSAQGPTLNFGKRLDRLQQETATHAAQRIMNALISGKPEKASEALYYYQGLMPKLVEMFKGCSASQFSTPIIEDDYAGVFVRFKLATPDGKVTNKRLALRKDNKQQLWVLDGGI